MASLYKKGGRWFIRYKSNGQWKGKSTGYRCDNIGETAAARKLAEKQTYREETVPAGPKGDPRWSAWVNAWIELRFGHLKTTTPERYRRMWRRLRQWLEEIKVERPDQLTYEMCQGYLGWRLAHSGKRNTAVGELKFMGQIMDEAIRRSWAEKNPARRLGIRKEASESKIPWTDEQIRAVMALLDREMFGSWMHVTFLLGLFQAARLRQCRVPLECIDLDREVIHYPANIIKGGEAKAKGFSQPIDPRLMDRLRSIVMQRKTAGETRLCEIPMFPSIEWRELLNSLGFTKIVHHGLRCTYITRAALAGVPMPLTMQFVNHASEEIHRIYQKIGVDDMRSISLRVAFPLEQHGPIAGQLESGQP